MDRIAFEYRTRNHCLIKKRKKDGNMRTTFLKCFQHDMYMIYIYHITLNTTASRRRLFLLARF